MLCKLCEYVVMIHYHLNKCCQNWVGVNLLICGVSVILYPMILSYLISFFFLHQLRFTNRTLSYLIINLSIRTLSKPGYSLTEETVPFLLGAVLRILLESAKLPCIVYSSSCFNLFQCMHGQLKDA